MNLFSDAALDAVKVQCHFKEDLCAQSGDLFSIPSVLSNKQPDYETELNLAAQVISKVAVFKTA